MTTLAKEYTDTKAVTHKVEHHVISSDGRHSKEQLLEELIRVLTKPERHDAT